MLFYIKNTIKTMTRKKVHRSMIIPSLKKEFEFVNWPSWNSFPFFFSLFFLVFFPDIWVSEWLLFNAKWAYFQPYHSTLNWGAMGFNYIFNNISAISWRTALLMEETWVHRETHQSAARHWQTLSHNVVLSRIQTHISGDRHWLHR